MFNIKSLLISLPVILLLCFMPQTVSAIDWVEVQTPEEMEVDSNAFGQPSEDWESKEGLPSEDTQDDDPWRIDWNRQHNSMDEEPAEDESSDGEHQDGQEQGSENEEELDPEILNDVLNDIQRALDGM